MNKINCLNEFKAPLEVTIPSTYFCVKNWRVKKAKYEDRLKEFEKQKIHEYLLKQCEGFTRTKHSDKELLSWIDSAALIYRIFSSPLLSEEIRKEAQAIQEYVIPYTNDNRPDFLIIKDNKICIIEFTFQINDFMSKAQQCFTYKNILEQFLSKDIDCVSYIFSYTDETKDDDTAITNQINDCISFLNHFFDKSKAYNEWSNIKIYR